MSTPPSSAACWRHASVFSARFCSPIMLTNIAASTLATGLLLSLFGQAGVIYATIVMTALIFVLCEVLPKTAAFNAPDRMALAVAQPIERTVSLLRCRS